MLEEVSTPFFNNNLLKLFEINNSADTLKGFKTYAQEHWEIHT